MCSGALREAPGDCHPSAAEAGLAQPAIRHETQCLRVAADRSPAGQVQPCGEPTLDQAAIPAALGTQPPPDCCRLHPGTAQAHGSRNTAR